MPRDNGLHVRIKSIREGRQMKQKEFAGFLGISQGYLSEIEKGLKQPSCTLLLLISNLFSLNIDWLTTGKGEANPNTISEPAASYTGTSRAKNKLRKNIKPLPNEAIKTWIDEFWAKAPDKERAWFEIEFERTFPEFKKWLSKNTTGKSK